MNCNHCGKYLNNPSRFCPYCGNRIKIENGLSKSQKIILISLLLVILIFQLMLLLPGTKEKNDTRTIMIYLDGSDLESNNKIVTNELIAIDPNKIDLTKTNIILYTGGTEKWHNFISNEENQIYILKSNGFEKIESQKQLNMGDPKTLTSFIKYCYDNYKTNKYDLIFYDHGGAIDGAIYDDFSLDNLSLEDMSKALEDSPFNENNKLEVVLFRTCLNGSLELANVFKNYSNYLIASEEVSYGSSYTNVLGFLNNILPEDDGLEFGIKFVDAYNNQMKILNCFNQFVQTYSVIDLNNIDNINKNLDNYIKSLDLEKNYKNVVRVRSNMYQYGVSDDSNFDMIDLYDFIDKTSKYSSLSATSLLKSISESVKYNKSNRTDAHGLSIYFPYNGKKTMKFKYLEIYDNLDYSNEYKNFIKIFNKMQQSPQGYAFNFSNNELTSSVSRNSFSITLTKEQLDTFSSSLFAIFEKDTDHPNYYKPIFSSDDTTLENNILKANINNNMLKIIDDDTKEEQYILVYHRKSNNNSRFFNGFIYNTTAEILDEDYMKNVKFIISNDKDVPFISSAKLISKNERIDGTLLNLDDYDYTEITANSFRILDDEGNVIDDWEPSAVTTGVGSYLDKIKLKNSGLDKGNNYYGLFILKDIYGNTSYSKLVKIGE